MTFRTSNFGWPVITSAYLTYHTAVLSLTTYAVLHEAEHDQTSRPCHDCKSLQCSISYQHYAVLIVHPLG